MRRGVKVATVIVVAILVVVLLRNCVATSYSIPSSGMENTLFKGERIIVNKWSYGLRLPFMHWWGYHRWGNTSLQSDEVVVFNNPGNQSEERIEKREVFIGRCIGLPGDSILVDSLFNTVASEQGSPDQKTLYYYPCKKEKALDSLLIRLSISAGQVLGKDSVWCIRAFSRYEYYLLEQMLGENNSWLYPVNSAQKHDIFRQLVIPRKGEAVSIYPWNAALLCNTLLLHEKKQAEVVNDTLYVEGKPVDKYRFTQNYYWMASDNAINLSDSRLFGLVPESHIIGKAAFIWYSKEENGQLFKGYRKERIGMRIK